MSLPDVVRERIERFDRNKSSYRNPAYLEEQLRVEFLNPFFIALGWDVSNEAGYAEGYKDVVHEDRVRIHGKAKAPDYSFRIGGQRKFFVEAKKPAVNIKEDVSPAYQLRRYAWSAKLPLSILTDFEEFAVYDTRIRPQPDDPASKGRVMYIRYNEYVDRWDEIASIFSKEAILLGSFDKYAHKKERRGVAEVDDAFLEEIERWREALAVDIARRNSNLGRRSLNYAVQQTIDRIVFLRICEDRGIEPYAKLRSLSERSAIYDALLKDFRAAEDRYNSGLFHFRVEKDREGQPDELTPALDVGNEVLGSILNSLYYPESPYEFSVLSADILGQVYERFLGRVIQLDQNHEASIVDKPEVRRSGGVYYTPVFIVDDIVEKTVGKLVEGKDWKAVRKLRILDPACGSGSFLIGAYKYLLDWHLQHYVDTETETHARGRPPRIYRDGKGDWQLTTHEKKRILLDNIYGVDIDRQAVEVTKLSLLLKMLEGESGESLDNQLKFFQERVLPDLSNNVRSGNSLIETDYFEGRPKEIFDDEDYLDINAFDWSSEFPNVYSNGGFDAVIGNPPYDVVEKERGAASWPHDTLRDYVGHKALYKPALGGKLNLFRFFAVRFLDLTKENGRFGMIMPLSLLADISTARTRAHLITSSRELEADCFPQKDDRNRRIFRDAKLSTAVYTGVKDSQVGKNEAFIRIRVYPANSFRDEHTEAKIFFKDVEILDPDNLPIPLVDEEVWKLCRRIHRDPRVVRLGEVPDFNITRGEINQTVYRDFITDSPDAKPLLKGAEIGRYVKRQEMSQGEKEWFDEKSYLKQGKAKPQVRERRIATQRITGVDEDLRIVATIIDPPAYQTNSYYFADSTNSIAHTSRGRHSIEYLLGLLNSKLFQWRFKLTSTNNNVGTNELQSMPFRSIDFNEKAERDLHDQMADEVLELLALKSKLGRSSSQQEIEMLRRRIRATDHAIEELVAKLYDLSAEDRDLINRSGRKPARLMAA